MTKIQDDRFFSNTNIWRFFKRFGILRGMILELFLCQQRQILLIQILKFGIQIKLNYIIEILKVN